MRQKPPLLFFSAQPPVFLLIQQQRPEYVAFNTLCSPRLCSGNKLCHLTQDVCNHPPKASALEELDFCITA